MPHFTAILRIPPRWVSAILLPGLAAAGLWALPAAEEPAVPAPLPTPEKPAAVTPPPLAPAAQAFVDRIRELRPNLSDEDPQTRDKALEVLRTETAAALETIFRVPPDEDTPDVRKLLTLIANELQAKIAYEQYLLKIPATQRAAVDTLVKKVPGFQAFFSTTTEEKIKLLEALVKTKPDAEGLAAFLTCVLAEKDPVLVTAALDHAAAAPSTTYLPVLEDLLKASYAELYLPKDAGANQMQMMMFARNNGGEISAWYAGLIKLTMSIPGERTDALLIRLFASLANPGQNQIAFPMGNRGGGNSVLSDVANALVKRNVQAAFPVLVKAAQTRSLMESSMRVNNNPVQYSSSADSMIYTACRLLDKTTPEQTPGQYGGIAWQSADDRLKFYDDFLDAWKADVKAAKPHREGIDDYSRWYDLNRRQMIQVMDMEKKQR